MYVKHRQQLYATVNAKTSRITAGALSGSFQSSPPAAPQPSQELAPHVPVLEGRVEAGDDAQVRVDGKIVQLHMQGLQDECVHLSAHRSQHRTP